MVRVIEDTDKMGLVKVAGFEGVERLKSQSQFLSIIILNLCPGLQKLQCVLFSVGR